MLVLWKYFAAHSKIHHPCSHEVVLRTNCGVFTNLGIKKAESIPLFFTIRHFLFI